MNLLSPVPYLFGNTDDKSLILLFACLLKIERGRMAIPYASTSLMFASQSPSKHCPLKQTPFLGFSVAVKPCISLNKINNNNNRRFSQIRCQDQATALVPLEQRWMFDESEIKGRVTPNPLFSVSLICFLSVLLFTVTF